MTTVVVVIRMAGVVEGVAGVVEQVAVVVEQMVVVVVIELDFFDLQRYPLHQHPCCHFLEIIFGLLVAEENN